MIRPLTETHRTVPNFTPSKCHESKMRKLIRIPVRQLTQLYYHTTAKELSLNYLYFLNPRMMYA